MQGRVAIREHERLLAPGAALLFIQGGGSVVLLVKIFYPPASSLLDLPRSQLLADSHPPVDKGRLVDAARNYRLILEKHPGNAEAITHLGNIALQRGDVETALRY
jgi:cytochrome c-type biogenesis protein CcmH/NrfG